MALLIPKLGKRLKRKPKPIARSKTRPNIKSKFKAQDNVFKTYKTRWTVEQVREYAARCQQQRLDDPTPAEDGLGQILRNLGIDYIREHIIFYAEGTRFLIADFYLPNHKVVLEADGSSHDLKKPHDAGKDAYLSAHGIRTLRFSNAAILRAPAAIAEKVIALLSR